MISFDYCDRKTKTKTKEEEEETENLLNYIDWLFECSWSVFECRRLAVPFSPSPPFSLIQIPLNKISTKIQNHREFLKTNRPRTPIEESGL